MSAKAVSRPALRRLAARLGILPRYADAGGTVRVASHRTIEALAAARAAAASVEAS